MENLSFGSYLFLVASLKAHDSNLWTVKACGGRTPAPTRTASRDSIPFIPQSSEREAVRLKVLSSFQIPFQQFRVYNGVITNVPSPGRWIASCTDQSRAEYITLEGAHVLPFSLNKFDEADEMLVCTQESSREANCTRLKGDVVHGVLSNIFAGKQRYRPSSLETRSTPLKISSPSNRMSIKCLGNFDFGFDLLT